MIAKYIAFAALLFVLTQATRVETTSLYADLVKPAKINYQVFSGYEDINWYAKSEFASIYYSLWESSTKRLSDHSAPLIIYLQGGPGLSSQYAAFREIGPLEISQIDKGGYKATENPWSWNYYGHLMFVDQPVGTGFSYNTLKDPDTTLIASKHFINFMWNFLKNQPWGIRTNPIYLAGEGYAGHFLPAFASMINQNSSLGFKVSGIILGGGLVNPEVQINTLQSFLGAAGIVSQNQRNITQYFTNQATVHVRNSRNDKAMKSMDNVWTEAASKNSYNGMNIHNYRRYNQDTEGIVYSLFLNNYKARHSVPQNVSFVEFNQHVASAFTMDTMVKYTHGLEYLLSNKVRVLIYNGQNDFKVTTAGVVSYLQSLEWDGADEWRKTPKEIWRQSGKISGWVKKHQNLIMAIVKDAGHYVYEDEATAAKSVYMMLNHYFAKHW